MAENLIISNGSKGEKYEVLYGQIKALAEGEKDLIANMANISSMIHQTFGFWWTGFYRVCGQELVLGPFQGPLACSRIRYGRGVCGTAWKEAKTIVVPVFNEGKQEVTAVLDIDSEKLNTFDQTDKEWLEKIVKLLEPNR